VDARVRYATGGEQELQGASNIVRGRERAEVIVGRVNLSGVAVVLASDGRRTRVRWKNSYEGLDALVAERGSALLGTAVLLTGSRVAGEDLLQAALERLVRHWSRVRGDKEGYLRRTLYHLAVDQWRSRRRRPEVLAEVEPPGQPDGREESPQGQQGHLPRLRPHTRICATVGLRKNLPPGHQPRHPRLPRRHRPNNRREFWFNVNCRPQFSDRTQLVIFLS